jgi:hypothetical protein
MQSRKLNEEKETKMSDSKTYANGGPTDVVPPNYAPARKPLTPDQFEAFRPAPAASGAGSKEDLFKILGPGAGLPRAAAQQLTNIIWALQERVALLEFAEQFRVRHLPGTEKRS